MKRKIIKIDEDKCTGCGECAKGCPEGALQIIDGKARLVNESFCDGLGACIGSCPFGAITIEEREADKYEEKKVMENIIKGGKNLIIAHLDHLYSHNQTNFLKEALEFLKEKNIEIDWKPKERPCCPGSQVLDFSPDTTKNPNSQLRQWPIQLHLIPTIAPYFKKADLLVAADCTAFSFSDFHNEFLKNKALVIACPKLDQNIEVYVEKIKSLIDEAQVNTITVLTMEVPCCFGLVNIVKEALSKSKRKVPIKHIVISIKGEVIKEDWI
ncbi:MAG: 4Fe-4S binding protein [Candidatus Omnitrophica bacterium]|nr:4Fe-4S binding protein [Candidatus Omnitrophota bacterium]